MSRICQAKNSREDLLKEEFRKVVQSCVCRRNDWRAFFSRRVQFAPLWQRLVLAASGLSLVLLSWDIATGFTMTALITAAFLGVVGLLGVWIGAVGRGVTVIEFLRQRGVTPHSAAAEFEKSLAEYGVLTDSHGASERMVRFVFLGNW
jgi:hypothetical protein